MAGKVLLGATPGGSDAVRLCSANPCLASEQTSSQPARWGQGDAGSANPQTAVVSGLSSGVTFFSARLSGTLGQEFRKRRNSCPQPSFSVFLPHLGQLTFNIMSVSFIKSLLVYSKKKSICVSSSNQDTWVEKDNCKTSQSL